MNIGIYANYLLFEQAGIGKYTENLIKSLLKIDHQNHYFLYFSYFRHRRARARLIKQKLGPLPANVTLRISSLPAAWLEWLFSTQFKATKIFQDPIDVYFSPYVSGIPKNGFSKMVTTCHDLVFRRFPEHRGRKLSNYYLRRHKIAAQRCKTLIVPSLATKKDLQKFLAVPSQRIQIIAEAADDRFRVTIDKRKKREVISRYFSPSVKYILSVGTLEPRKNLTKLVEAFSILPHQILRQYQLVLVGAQGWRNEQLARTIDSLNLKDKVIITGFVKDEDLPYIYKGATVFVYPSLYEGFGLPPLEAMACGVPVISSNISSLPEVIDGAGILVDPENEVAIAEAIKKLILKPKLAQKIAKKGKARSRKFSWERAAKETLKLFKTINT